MVGSLLLVGQGATYLGILLGFLDDKVFEKSGPMLPFYYLAMINLSLMIGLWRTLKGRQQAAVDRTPR